MERLCESTKRVKPSAIYLQLTTRNVDETRVSKSQTISRIVRNARDKSLLQKRRIGVPANVVV